MCKTVRMRIVSMVRNYVSVLSSAIHPPRNFTASMKCEDNSLTIFVTKDEMGGVTAKELHLSVESCLGEDFNKTHFRVSSAFDQCGTIAEVKEIIILLFYLVGTI